MWCSIDSFIIFSKNSEKVNHKKLAFADKVYNTRYTSACLSHCCQSSNTTPFLVICCIMVDNDGTNIFCTACNDNFIINKLSLSCHFCQRKFHPHCLRMKDSLHKAINECDNLYWFCDICRPVVSEKLSSNLQPAPISPKLIESIESIVTNVVGSKLQEHSILYEASIRSFEYQLSETQKQVTLMRQSNIDMVNMLSRGGRSCELPKMDQMKTSDVSGPVNELQNEPGSHFSGVPQVDGVEATNSTNSSGQVLKSYNGLSRNAQNLQTPPDSDTSDTSTKRKPGGNLSGTFKVTTLRGSGKASDTLKVAPKGRNWVWVGNLARTTTAEQILQHLSKSHPKKDFLAFDLKSKSKKNHLKWAAVTFPLSNFSPPTSGLTGYS